jgi:glutamate racemase
MSQAPRAAGKWKTANGYSTGSGVDRDAIGIFDSGVGGLTVMHELVGVLPAESFIYLGDTGRYPYGNKSAETVTRYSLENASFLVEKGIKLLVVACNAASSVALDALRAECRVPVVGVIEPGAKAAAASTGSGRVGVIGTEVTIASGAYTRALKRLRPKLEIYTRACPLFVPLAEEGWTDNEVAHATIALYLGSLQRSGIDTLILGCTHYPLLKRAIADFLGNGVRLVDSAEETAQEVRETLKERGQLRRRGRGATSFFVTDVPDRFIKVGRRFLGERVESAVRIER